MPTRPDSDHNATRHKLTELTAGLQRIIIHVPGRVTWSEISLVGTSTGLSGSAALRLCGMSPAQGSSQKWSQYFPAIGDGYSIAVSDDGIERSLRNLAFSDRADHVPKYGAIAAVVAGILAHLAFSSRGHDGGTSVIAAVGVAALVVGFTFIVAWPYVRWRHHKTMRERALFIFRPGDDRTRWALQSLIKLESDLAADQRFVKLLVRLRTMPEYEADFARLAKGPVEDPRDYPSGQKKAIPVLSAEEERQVLAVMRPRNRERPVDKRPAKLDVPHPDTDQTLELDIDRTGQLAAINPPPQEPEQQVAADQAVELDIDRTAQLAAIDPPPPPPRKTPEDDPGTLTGGHAIPLELPPEDS